MPQQMPNEYPLQPQVVGNRNNEARTLDILELLYYLWGHMWQIALCLVLGVSAALLYTWYTASQADPQYKATAQVCFVPNTNNVADAIMILSDLPQNQVSVSDVVEVIKKIQNLPSEKSMIADYKALLLSRPLLQDVIANLSLDMNTATLENMLAVSSQEDSHIIKIVVTGSDPQETADVANELVSQGNNYFQEFIGLEPPKELESASAPTTEFSKADVAYAKNMVLGGGLVAILYCGFLLVRFLMNDTIITPDDVVECFGVQPLTTVPELDRKTFGGMQCKKESKWKKGEAR